MTDRPTNEARATLLAASRDADLGPEAAAELELLAELLADPTTWVEPDAALEDAVARAVAVADAEPDASTTATRADVERRATRARRRVVLWAAAAAVALGIAVPTTVAVTGGGTSTDYTARLSATGVAHGAQASAEFTRADGGFRVTLDAQGLPRLANGEYYQAWLKDGAGTLVPIGTFSSGDDRITLWSGVSPDRFPMITVTIESPDNNQASSGRLVLVGEVHRG